VYYVIIKEMKMTLELLQIYAKQCAIYVDLKAMLKTNQYLVRITAIILIVKRMFKDFTL